VVSLINYEKIGAFRPRIGIVVRTNANPGSSKLVHPEPFQQLVSPLLAQVVGRKYQNPSLRIGSKKLPDKCPRLDRFPQTHLISK
jgi:hypothetical protein